MMLTIQKFQQQKCHKIAFLAGRGQIPDQLTQKSATCILQFCSDDQYYGIYIFLFIIIILDFLRGCIGAASGCKRDGFVFDFHLGE